MQCCSSATTEDAEDAEVQSCRGSVAASSPSRSPSSIEKKTTFTYDWLGRLRRRVNPDNSTSEMTGGAVTVRDENAHETLQTRQAFGDPDDTRLTALTDADGNLWSSRK